MSYFSGASFNDAIIGCFRDVQIEDLWIRYFCVSTDVANDCSVVHQTGPLWRYCRASMTVIGLLPPIVDQHRFLVDGGYTNNLPVDVMRALAPRLNQIIAVDVENKDNSLFEGIPDYGDSVSGWYIAGQWLLSLLRLAPPLIMLMRKVHTPFAVCGTVVPRDHYVFAPVAVSMNLPEGAPDCAFTAPAAFDPDRFAPPREEGKGTLAFCAFGGGVHACLGEQFGYLQVKTIVSILLRRFEIEAVGPLPKPNHTAMVVGPLQTNNSCVIKYRRRTTPLAAPPAAAAPAAAAAQ